MSQKGPAVIDPLSKIGRELKAAEDFFALAKSASSPFIRAYYQRVAERYLSSEGDLKQLKRQSDETGAIPAQPPRSLEASTSPLSAVNRYLESNGSFSS
jgi:hypothetical protein